MSDHPKATLICTSGGKLPIASGVVDHFISLHTLEHVYLLAEMFEEITRILKPKGWHHFVIPCEGGFPFAFGRAVMTGPNLRRKYDLDINFVMSREHINDANRIKKFLRLYFKNLTLKHWPLPFLPLLNGNVMIWGRCQIRTELLPFIHGSLVRNDKITKPNR